ncbi:transglutaminase-like domain-containing protein [Phycicoccus sonneratiae]|uniref:Transglutaminase domain-containing protein n=1 Tax=Phycicoccus sonneratiae TaxID=2807628 RepID=A0ABS2CQ68_9MICO|nr:transglutaminase-like domain-containing protein [Phycicoccus sonneraticus]MBM6401950.1 transglutaminase domain-containing protein [Phycicoccus sonneraticus]
MTAESAPTRSTAGVPEVGWAVLVLVVGAVGLAQAYRGWLPALVLGGTAAAGVLVVLAGRALRTSTLVTTLAALALLVLGTTLLLRAGDTAAGEQPWRLLADAVPRLVTGPRPAPAAPDLLAPSVLLTGLVSVLAGVRLGRPSRLRASAPVGAAVLLVAGAALTAGAADPYGLLAVVLVVVTVLGWGLLDRPQRSPGAVPHRNRELVVASVALALVAVPVVVGGAVLARDDAFDPRSVVEPPVTDVTVANPMPMLDAWARDPQRELFTVEGAVFPLHLAVLTEYDGAAWAAPSAFRPLGEAEALLPAGERQAEVDAQVTVVNLPAPWLPVSGSPETVDRASALVDVDSGSLIDPRVRSGTAYRALGLVDAPDEAAATAAGLPDPATVGGLLATRGLPDGLRQYALSAVEGTAAPFARAKAVEAAVRGNRTLDPTAPGGSSYRRMQTFLLGDEGTPGAQAGGSEQFATAFAVLARAAGLPTRVVVGFTPGTEDTRTGVRTVRGEDALAWPEVYFTGAGWVPFSPTPDLADLGPDVPDDTPIPSAAPTPVPEPSTAVTVDVTAPGAAASGPDLTPLVLGGGAVLLVVAAPLLVLGALRARRRSAHRRAGARGSWAELLDVADLAGLRAHPGQDARELATALDARAGDGRRAATVVAAAEAEAWSPEGSSPAAGDPWQTARSIARAVRRRTSAGRRATWGVHPRPLRAGGTRKVPLPQRLREPAAVPQDDHERWAPESRADRED